MVFVYNFKGYKIAYTKEALKDFKKIDELSVIKIKKKLNEMVEGAQNNDIKRLQGIEDQFRLRVADYRVIFQKTDQVITIYVISVAHRKDVYKDL